MNLWNKFLLTKLWKKPHFKTSNGPLTDHRNTERKDTSWQAEPCSTIIPMLEIVSTNLCQALLCTISELLHQIRIQDYILGCNVKKSTGKSIYAVRIIEIMIFFNTCFRAKGKLWIFPKYSEIYSPAHRQKNKSWIFLLQSIRITEDNHLEFSLACGSSSLSFFFLFRYDWYTLYYFRWTTR